MSSLVKGRLIILLAFGVAAVPLGLAMLLLLGGHDVDGAATPEDLVSRYVSAVNQQDEVAMKHLLSPKPDARHISDELATWTPIVVTDTRRIDLDTSGERGTATLTGSMDGAPLRRTLALGKHSGAWFVEQNGGPKATPAPTAVAASPSVTASPSASPSASKP